MKNLNQIIKQKEPSVAELVDENHSLRTKNRAAYAVAIASAALTLVIGGYAHKTNSSLNKANQENKDLRESIEFYQKDTINLSEKVMNLSDYANDAETLANSMQFYPDMPDSVGSLDEKDQEKAEKEFEKINQEKQAEHDKLLKTLAVDRDLLFRVQQGPQIGD